MHTFTVGAVHYERSCTAEKQGHYIQPVAVLQHHLPSSGSTLSHPRASLQVANWPFLKVLNKALATVMQMQIITHPFCSSRSTSWYMKIASHSLRISKHVPCTDDDVMLMPVLSVNMALLSAFSTALLSCEERVLVHLDDAARVIRAHSALVAACDGCASPTWHQSTPPGFKCKNSSRSCCTMASMWANE